MLWAAKPGEVGEFMPIYAFECQACGHGFEVMQKMSEAPPTVCTACGKSELRKLLSAAGFQLKGSGWYVTDFKGGAKPSTEAKPSTTDTKTSTDAKPSPAKGSTDSGPKTGSGTT